MATCKQNDRLSVWHNNYNNKKTKFCYFNFRYISLMYSHYIYCYLVLPSSWQLNARKTKAIKWNQQLCLSLWFLPHGILSGYGHKMDVKWILFSFFPMGSLVILRFLAAHFFVKTFLFRFFQWFFLQVRNKLEEIILSLHRFEIWKQKKNRNTV